MIPKFDKPLKCLVLLLFGLFVLSYTVNASNRSDFLKGLEGTWSGVGTSMGNAARLEMRWEWVLGGKFLHLTLRNEMQTAAGQKQIFEGRGYYQPTDEGKCQGTWLDSQGASFPITGRFDGDTLTVLWGSPGKEHGKSVYRFLNANKLEVVDSIKQKDGTWKQFAAFVVTRRQ